MKANSMRDYREKSKAAYNIKADGYDNSREGQFTRNIQRLLISEMAWTENQSLLDVACGSGGLILTPIRGLGTGAAHSRHCGLDPQSPTTAHSSLDCGSSPQ